MKLKPFSVCGVPFLSLNFRDFHWYLNNKSRRFVMQKILHHILSNIKSLLGIYLFGASTPPTPKVYRLWNLCPMKLDQYCGNHPDKSNHLWKRLFLFPTLPVNKIGYKYPENVQIYYGILRKFRATPRMRYSFYSSMKIKLTKVTISWKFCDDQLHTNKQAQTIRSQWPL